MRRVTFAVVMLVVAGACGDAPEERVDPKSPPSLRPLEEEPSTIETLPEPPAGGSVLTAEADDVIHELWTDGGCVHVRSTVPDAEPNLVSRCDVQQPYWAQSTGDCFRYLPREESSDRTVGDYSTPVPDICQIEMTPAFYGHANEDVGWLCMARHDGEGSFGPVGYIATDGPFLVLQEPGIRWAKAHPYTPDGKRWGEPPLDAPSSFIYAMCETNPLWDPTPTIERYLYTLARLDPSLVGDDTAALFLDPGTGPAGFSFGIDDTGIFDVGLEIWTDATDLTITYTDNNHPDGTLIGVYPLPEPIVTELTSGWECRDAAVLLVDVRESIRDSDPDAVTLTALTSAQAAEIAGDSVTGYDTNRPPGTPCPDSGTERTSPETPAVETIVEGAHRFVVAPSILGLGTEWSINIHDVDGSGYGPDMAHLTQNPDETYWGYLFPGTHLTLSFEKEGEDDPERDAVAVPVPPLPDSYGPPYLIQVEVTGYDNSGNRPALRGEDITVTWVTP